MLKLFKNFETFYFVKSFKSKNSIFYIRIFLKEHDKIVIDYNDKKDKIERFYHNYEILNIQPLKYSSESYVLDLYKKLYNNLLQQKEEELNKLNREFKENFNDLVIYMKKLFYFYITKLYQTKSIRLYYDLSEFF